MIKALFFDIDGTLVSFKTHHMSDALKAALHQAQVKGIKIFISTGRCHLNFEPLENYPFDGYIAMNGARIVVGGRIIEKHPLEKAASMKIADVMMSENIPCWVFSDDIIGINCMNEHSTQISNETLLKPRKFYDLREVAANHDVYEYSAFMTEEEVDAQLKPLFPNLAFPRWHPYFCDIIMSGLSKSYGASRILEAIGCKREDCMAFGDGGNDIPIIEYAGVGVAMGNATDDVKAAADYVTLSVDDDGIPAALRHFGII